MKNLVTGRTPRWLGWVLLVSGGLAAIGWTCIIVVVALFAKEPWGDVAGDFVAFLLIGVLAAAAGFRVLRGTGRAKVSTS